MSKNRGKLNTPTECVSVTALALCLCLAQTLRGQIRFTDVTELTGVTFEHTDGSSGSRYIVESVSAGVALFDYDGDKDVDIYFLNGAALQGAVFETPPRNALYRNDGNFSFTDVTDRSGLGDTGYGLGVTVGDYDNDGDADVYLNNLGPNVLYRNNGDGTFTDVTKSAGVGNGDKVGAGTCFLDMDGDGDLDLFVSNYLKWSPAIHVPHRMKGFPQYGTPLDYPPEPDTMYRNDGDGTFTDVSAICGIGEYPGTGMGTVCGDYDNDGDTDIFVGNDVMGNFLFANDGLGRFEEVGLLAGVAYDYYGREQASMGVDCGDYDNDGRLDFFMTSYTQELSTLYHNLGDGIFEDATIASGAGVGTLNDVTWGTGLVDFDNDGDRDIFIASGHVQDNVENYDSRTTYPQLNIVQMNTGEGRFINVSDDCGTGMEVRLASRGAGFDDMDNDGDVDVVVLNSRTSPTILRNDSSGAGHWLKVRLQGVKANRDGVGARVKVVAGDLTLVDEVHSGRGYQSHFGTCLHFGLGRRRRIDRIEVRWIGGGTDVFTGTGADQSVTLVEGKANPASTR
ncbi:MAG: CRTAC1 family protein [Phycisphaerales bacterium]|nr:MAG: CRTAC1 family protein [Phycisphaerales bacterium]